MMKYKSVRLSAIYRVSYLQGDVTDLMREIVCICDW